MKSEAVRCVVLADRHHGLTEGMRTLLETSFDAVVMVANESSLVESTKRLQPELAVVDLALTPGAGLQWVKSLRCLCPQLKLILLSVHDEPSICRSAMDAGADAFVLKRAIATDLMPAIDAVLEGKHYCSPGALTEVTPGTRNPTD